MALMMTAREDQSEPRSITTEHLPPQSVAQIGGAAKARSCRHKEGEGGCCVDPGTARRRIGVGMDRAESQPMVD